MNREPLKPQEDYNGYSNVFGTEHKTNNYTDNELLYDIALSLRLLIKKYEEPLDLTPGSLYMKRGYRVSG
jgi:hypothetical protein